MATTVVKVDPEAGVRSEPAPESWVRLPEIAESIQTNIYGKKLDVTITPRALRALSKRTSPLLAEMELYFSCLIRKRVIFREEMPRGAEENGLYVSFRPVQTHVCMTDSYEGRIPPLDEFPINRPAPFMPRRLTIDYKRGRFQGEYSLEKIRD